MAGSMKEIKLRIKSVESTMQITKAMELVASSKLPLVYAHRKIRKRACHPLKSYLRGIKGCHHALRCAPY